MKNMDEWIIVEDRLSARYKVIKESEWMPDFEDIISMGTYRTRKEAEDELRQIENRYF